MTIAQAASAACDAPHTANHAPNIELTTVHHIERSTSKIRKYSNCNLRQHKNSWKQCNKI